jgi:hypothetical protein
MGKGRQIQPHEFTQIVRESSPSLVLDADEEEGYDQAQPTRILVRGPLTDEEKDEIVAWMIQRIRCLARIHEGRPPTELELCIGAALMQCYIWTVDMPKKPEGPRNLDDDITDDDDYGVVYVDLVALAVLVDLILVRPAEGKQHVYNICRELAQRLMQVEVPQELFWAVEVRIEAHGWDNDRERLKLAERVASGLMHIKLPLSKERVR